MSDSDFLANVDKWLDVDSHSEDATFGIWLFPSTWKRLMGLAHNGAKAADTPILRATIARIEGEKADLERHVEELREKFAAPVCACSYDYPGDVCMAHSPLLKKALSEKEALEADKAKLREELSAAVGYMTNAAIDLDTGAPKRTALATINGGIQRARLALAETGEKP